MSGSGGISQMLKGIIIGVVLIMAIIGTMSLLEDGNPLSSLITKDKVQPATKDPIEIVAPSITLNPDDTQVNLNQDNSTNIGDLNADIIEEKISPEAEPEVTVNDTNIDDKPILEDERTAEEATALEKPPVVYGMMVLKSVDSNSGQALKASYSVFDKNNAKIAESKNATDTSYRLPIGQYKVETTLTKLDEATNQNIPVLTKSRYIIVRKNATTNQTFEMEPPASTGVLQVSAKMNDKIIRANYVIQKTNGEVIASRNNVTNSLFKLNTGSYKVTVTSGNNKDFRSVEVKAGESTQTVFQLKEANTPQGKLLVRVFDTNSSNPVRADILITAANGTVVQELTSSTKTELTLAAGEYKIAVKGPNGTSNKNIKINPGQALNEIFRFETQTANTTNTQESNNGTQINENVTIKPVVTETPPADEPIAETNKKVTLRISSQDQASKKPMKSNIYIQTMGGKHLDKRTYVDGASFSLDPGTYKVTVRATNRKNTVKTIRITGDTNLNEIFLLEKPNTQTASINTKQATNPAIKQTTQESPTNTPNTIATGFLNVSMQAPRNQRVNRNDLKSHFIVSTLSGRKIVELTSVPVGNFKLDVGSYNVTAIHNGKRKQQRVNVRSNQNTRLAFNTTDFQAVKGVLRSRIVDGAGRPLKGNLSVKNMAGQVVARADNVSTATFNLAPARHTINVSIQGLSGNEVVNISANETTVQTFTIAANRTNQPRDIKEILKQKLEKEIRRQTR